MVGESVWQVRNSDRSLAWTAGWQESANSVQDTAVLQRRGSTAYMSVSVVGILTSWFHDLQAGMWEFLECMLISSCFEQRTVSLDKGKCAHAIRSPSRSCACSLAYQLRY